MVSIVIAFPKIEDANKIRTLFVRNGYDVVGVCTMGAQAIAIANNLDGGIIVCGYRLNDMHYTELFDFLPVGFEMLLIASATRLEDCTEKGIVCLSMPIKTKDLYDTLEMMTYNYQRRKRKERAKPKQRSAKDKAIVDRAKALLMERNNMTEEEAHRYIQKNSMDSGTNLVEMAEMILSMLWIERS